MSQRAELSHKWRGDDIGYGTAHQRAWRVLPRTCAHADQACKGVLHAAFNHDTPARFVKLDPSGRRYSPRPEDYLPLCQVHHLRYDLDDRPRYKVEILGNEVTRRRMIRALSREALAEKADISPSRLAKIEAGLAGGVSTGTVNGLCRALDCDPQDISEVLERQAS